MREHAAPDTANVVLEIFMESPDIFMQKVFYNWNVISADLDDNKFFDIAVAANVDYLITNDHHFDVVKKLTFPKVTVITSEDFLELPERTKS